MNYAQPRLKQMLAAEYVLGTLHGRARRRFARLLESRADLRAEVRYWEQRLAALQSGFKPVAPRDPRAGRREHRDDQLRRRHRRRDDLAAAHGRLGVPGLLVASGAGALKTSRKLRCDASTAAAREVLELVRRR